MNVYLQELLKEKRGTFKAYVRGDMARLSLELNDGHRYEASGRDYDTALSKLIEQISCNKPTMTVKQARKNKKKLIEQLLTEDEEFQYL